MWTRGPGFAVVFGCRPHFTICLICGAACRSGTVEIRSGGSGVPASVFVFVVVVFVSCFLFCFLEESVCSIRCKYCRGGLKCRRRFVKSIKVFGKPFFSSHFWPGWSD